MNEVKNGAIEQQKHEKAIEAIKRLSSRVDNIGDITLSLKDMNSEVAGVPLDKSPEGIQAKNRVEDVSLSLFLNTLPKVIEDLSDQISAKLEEQHQEINSLKEKLF